LISNDKAVSTSLTAFAYFAEYRLVSGSGLPADLYEDDIVDRLDVDEFVYEWLYYCPYDWPLK